MSQKQGPECHQSIDTHFLDSWRIYLNYQINLIKAQSVAKRKIHLVMWPHRFVDRIHATRNSSCDMGQVMNVHLKVICHCDTLLRSFHVRKTLLKIVSSIKLETSAKKKEQRNLFKEAADWIVLWLPVFIWFLILNLEKWMQYVTLWCLRKGPLSFGQRNKLDDYWWPKMLFLLLMALTWNNGQHLMVSLFLSGWRSLRDTSPMVQSTTNTKQSAPGSLRASEYFYKSV